MCTRVEPLLIVTEFLSKGCPSSQIAPAHFPGNLRSFLHRTELSRVERVSIVSDIAQGLLFLSQRGVSPPPPLVLLRSPPTMLVLTAGVVHCDLAARNCLVALDMTVKIGTCPMPSILTDSCRGLWNELHVRQPLQCALTRCTRSKRNCYRWRH